MLNLLSATVLVPLLGAACILLASLLLLKLDVARARAWNMAAAGGFAFATLILVWVLRADGGAWDTLSSGTPLLLAGSVVRFQTHPALWPLALVFTLVSLSFLVPELGGARRTPPRVAALALLLLGVGLAALWSANPLTMIVTWAIYDLVYAAGHIMGGEGRVNSARVLAFNSAATLLLWIGVLAAADGTGIVQWSLIPAGGPKMGIWVIAGLMRVGVYPLHFATPSRMDGTSRLAGTLFLSPVIGWGLLTRLAAVNGGVLPVQPWAVLLGAVSLAAGGLLAWTAKSSQDVRRWIAMGTSGAVFLAAALSSLNVGAEGVSEALTLPILTLGISTWLLCMGILFLAEGLAVPRCLRREELPVTVPSLVGALSIISLPMMLGSVGESSSVADLLRGRNWGANIPFLLGQVLLVAAVMRWLFAGSMSERSDGNRLEQFSRALGLVVPGASLVLLGLAPGLVLSTASPLAFRQLITGPGLGGWLIWAGSVLLGAALAWRQDHLRRGLASWLDAAHHLVLLDWAYGLLIGAFEQGFAAIRTIDDVLGGRGALLWSLVLLLGLILILRIR